MDNSISKLVKSKSSNSALTKPITIDKKSRSNGALQTLLVKKRGMYVENKPYKEIMNYQVDDTVKKEKASSRRLQGQTPIRASILTILSKSSINTQCEVITDKTKIKKKPIKYVSTSDAVKIQRNGEKKTKYKCKSTVLSRNYYRNKLDDIKFETIKPRKDLVNTPSIYSVSSDIKDEDLENIKWSAFLPRLVNPDEDEVKLEKEKKLSHLVREVTEGKILKDAKVKAKVDEPPSLVSELQTDKGLFNFFVDLLETTISVYNVTAEYGASTNVASAVSSQIALEIDESVANKLNVGFGSPIERSPNPSSHYRLGNGRQYWYDNKKPNKCKVACYSKSKWNFQSPTRFPVKKKQFKSESFAFTKHQNLPSYSRSTVSPQRKSRSKISNKKYLLNLLKEQLNMDVCTFEEPQNLYQALKVMAQTKQKSHKTIRFNKFVRNGNDCDECTFKRRNMISPRKSRSRLYNENIPKTRAMSPRSFHFNKRYIQSPTTSESNHSLEVFNIDYDMNGRRKKSKLSRSDSEDNFKQYDAMLKHVLKTVEAMRKA